MDGMAATYQSTTFVPPWLLYKHQVPRVHQYVGHALPGLCFRAVSCPGLVPSTQPAQAKHFTGWAVLGLLTVPGPLTPGLGVAGLRLHSPIDTPSYNAYMVGMDSQGVDIESYASW